MLAWPDNSSTRGIYNIYRYITTIQPPDLGDIAQAASASNNGQSVASHRQAGHWHTLAHSHHPLSQDTAQYDAQSQMSSTKHVKLTHSIITHMPSLIHRHMPMYTFINGCISINNTCMHECMHRRLPPVLRPLPQTHRETTMHAFVDACIVDDDAFMNVCMGM